MKRSIRVNTRLISVEDFQMLADKEGWQLDPVPWCKEGFYIDRDDKDDVALGSLQAHLDGLFYVQEASSMFPPEIVEHSGNELILDASCAPGSKLTQIANKNLDALVIGNEPKAKRLLATTTNLERLQIDNVVLTQYDASFFAKITPNSFDKVFLDAPCSNIHSLTDVDKVSSRKIKFMASIQKRLIKEAFKAVKPGGFLIYSTCTISEDENENNVKTLLEKFPQAELVPVDLEKMGLKSEISSEILPGTVRMKEEHYGSDIFFIALIKKNKSTPTELEGRKIFNFKKFIDKKATTATEYIIDYMGARFQIRKELLTSHFNILEMMTPKWLGLCVQKRKEAPKRNNKKESNKTIVETESFWN